MNDIYFIMTSYSYNSDTFESSTKDITSYVSETLKRSPRKSLESPRKSFAQSYGSDTFESTMMDSYATDTFESGSSGENTSRQPHYSLDTFENVTITESMPVSYGMDSFESTVDDSRSKVGYSTDTFESSDTGETVARASYTYDTRASYSTTDTYDSYDSYDDSDTVTSQTTDSFESIILSPRKSEAAELEKQQRLEAVSSEAQNQFLERLMQHFQQDDDDQVTKTPSRKKTLSDSEKVIRKYCKKKIKSLKKKNDEITGVTSQGYQQPEKVPVRRVKQKDDIIDDYGIPSAFLERLKITNILESMEQACKAEIHVPKKCKKCRKKMTELTAAKFIRERKAKALSKLVDLKMEEHLYQRDSITLIGSIMKDMPDLRQPPHEIWQRLQDRCSDTHTTTSPGGHNTQPVKTVRQGHISKQLCEKQAGQSENPMNYIPTNPKEVWMKLLAKFKEKQVDVN